MRFRYTVHTKDRGLITGRLEAENQEVATNILNYGDYSLVNIKPDIPFIDYDKFLARFSQVDVREIVRFNRQLALLLESGADLLASLRLLQQQVASKTLKKVIGQVIDDIRGGNSLSAALVKHPGVFPDLYCRTIEAGESAGSLEIALRHVADYMEKEANAQKKIKNALTYPIIVAVVAIIVVFVILIFVFPVFIELYENLGAEPPVTMRLLLDLSAFLSQYWLYVILGVLAVIILAFAYIQTRNGKYQWHRLLLKLPVIGRIVHLNQLARSCQIMSLLFKVGLPVPEIVRVAIRSATNMVLVEALTGVQQELMGGSGLSAPMARRKIFLPVMVQMVASGEETGNLDATLLTTAETFAVESEDMTNNAIELILPVMTVVLGVLVAFIAITIVSTIYSFYGQIG
ncbi:type II secretion system F family protein [Chloroflexota bacterium]